MKPIILTAIFASGIGFLGGTIFGVLLIRTPDVKFGEIHCGATRESVHTAFGEPDVTFISENRGYAETYHTFLNKYIFFYSNNREIVVSKWKEE